MTRAGPSLERYVLETSGSQALLMRRLGAVKRSCSSQLSHQLCETKPLCRHSEARI
ncbi:MAG: hypothetical protein ACLTXS_08415 [[Clostridium] symbiosum]